MPGYNCSVFICESNSSDAKKSGEKIGFFSFPKDPIMRQEWINRCCRSTDFNPENKKVCSKHFSENDYMDGIQARLMNTVPKRLKVTAVPCLNLLPSNVKTEDVHTRRSKRRRKKLTNNRISSLKSISYTDEPFANFCSQNVSPTCKLQRIQPKKAENFVKQTIFVSKSIFQPPEEHAASPCQCSGKNTLYNSLKNSYDALVQENAVLRNQIQVHIRKEEILQEKITQLQNCTSLSNVILLVQ